MQEGVVGEEALQDQLRGDAIHAIVTVVATVTGIAGDALGGAPDKAAPCCDDGYLLVFSTGHRSHKD
ncbi:hypothetical protein [Chromohalobacter nigrandesensis]|uniref:hypothetical protein n=1 Tax=Chromohalobacter nigrandesensis TaxID=119863 RepID=UPI003CCFF38D